MYFSNRLRYEPEFASLKRRTRVLLFYDVFSAEVRTAMMVILKPCDNVFGSKQVYGICTVLYKRV